MKHRKKHLPLNHWKYPHQAAESKYQQVSGNNPENVLQIIAGCAPDMQ